MQPGQQVSVGVTGSCANMQLQLPSPGLGCSVALEERSDLIAVTRTIDRWRTEGLIADELHETLALFAVWVVTDRLDALALDPAMGAFIRSLVTASGLDLLSYRRGEGGN